VSLDELRQGIRIWVDAGGSRAELARRVGRKATTVKRIAADTLTPSPALHRQLEAALATRPKRRRAGRPLGDSGTVRDRLRMNPCRLVAADWKRIRGDHGLVAAEQCPEWALIEARPVSAQQVNEVEREVRRLALLPQEERTDQAYQELLDACDARTDAHRNRRGPSDHAIVRELTHEAFTWGCRDEDGLASEVKSDANNLRRGVTARQREGLLPAWVYDDDEALPAHPRAHVVFEQLLALRASASPVIEQPFLELARAARWAHTQEHITAEKPLRMEHRRRIEDQVGRPQAISGESGMIVSVDFDRETDGP
jgi:hypothetical protein